MPCYFLFAVNHVCQMSKTSNLEKVGTLCRGEGGNHISFSFFVSAHAVISCTCFFATDYVKFGCSDDDFCIATCESSVKINVIAKVYIL